MGKTERIAVRTMSGRKSLELNNALISVIGDEDTVTGMLLAGVGNVDARRTSNFLVVDAKTSPAQIEEAFQRLTKRNDIAVIIINQYIASMIRPAIDAFEGTSPAILEVPSKEHPYDPDQDAIHRRIDKTAGGATRPERTPDRPWLLGRHTVCWWVPL